MTDLERTLNTLAEAIEATLRHPHFDDVELGRRLADLHVEIVSKLCRPLEHHEAMGGAWAMTGIPEPTTLIEAMEQIAGHRAAWVALQAETRSDLVC